MELIEVISKSDIRLFHRVVKQIYDFDKNYIPHLIDDIEAVFDKRDINTKAKRWVVIKDNQHVGRIAAFTTSKLGAGG